MKKVLICCLLVLLYGCQSQKASQDAFTWQVFIKDTVVIKTLETDKTITHYDGSSETITNTNEASSGKTYLLIDLEVNKAKTGSHSFLWNDLSLLDQEGNLFYRLDDQFLVQHNYERLSGIDLRLGDSRGWIAFEIPEASSKQKLILVHSSDEGDNKITVLP